MKKVLILDGNALLHRAWHAVPPLTTDDGRVVNAVFGFTNIVEKMRKLFTPDYFVVAWDLPGGTFRDELYEDYKAGREEKADELYAQIEIIQDVMSLYGIPSLSAPGFEADDVIGTLAAEYGPKKGFDVFVVTGDMDALQLVDDQVSVVSFVRGVSETKIYDAAAVVERYGIRPDQMIDYKALMGDSSDNIPGIAGIGKKSAMELLQRFEDIEGVYRAIDEGLMPSKWEKKLMGKQEECEAMRKLVTIVRDVALPGFDLEDAVCDGVDAAGLVKMFGELGFRTLARKYEGDVSSVEVVVKDGEGGDSDVREEPVGGKAVGMSDLVGRDEVVVWVEEREPGLFGERVGRIALMSGGDVCVVDDPKDADLGVFREVLDGAEVIVAHDLKGILHLVDFDGELGKVFDVKVAGYLVANHHRSFGMEELLDHYLPGGKLKKGEDAVRSVKGLADVLRKRLEEDGVLRLAEEIEMPLLGVLYAMERRGILLDSAFLGAFSVRLGDELEVLTKTIYEAAGREFNIKSPSQLADVLFVDLALPTKGIKKTKTGFSTAASELDKLADQHVIVGLVRKYRELAKLKSTYVDALPTMVGGDGRVHSTFDQTVTATGRLSSHDPNLQNIPIRTEMGREVRKAFVADEGKKFIVADYSQFELRVAAVLADDKAFLEAFREGADIHRLTAAQVLDKELGAVTSDERRAAKGINFGILYGMGSRSLARNTGMKAEEAKGFIERYFGVHPGIQGYIDETKVKAHEDGYVETSFGRRRYLPGIDSGVGMLRAQAERMAVNMPIQGTQADLVKRAMIAIEEWARKSDLDVGMLVQVHDELVFEVAEGDVDEAMGEIKRIMEGVWPEGGVPLVVEPVVGDSWDK